MPPLAIPLFAARQLTLLEAELAAETAESSALTTTLSPAALQRAGAALINLCVAATRTGFGGKTVLDLEPDSATGGEMAEHGLRVGDIVRVQEMVGGSAKKREKAEVEKRGVQGVVSRVWAGKIAVAVDGEGEELGMGGRLWIVKLANDVTYKRMNDTMKKLTTLAETNSTTELMNVLFGHTTPRIPSASTLESLNITWQSPHFNDSQKHAIRFALASPDLALIHGPPGTGKTHTLIELILQLLALNQRVLVCGPSNISVDNIVERLAPHKIPLVRLGHPARLLPAVLAHSLDVLTQTSSAAALVRDVRADIDSRLAQLKTTRGKAARSAVYGEVKELRKEYRERERGVVGGVVGAARVVLATLHGAGGRQLRGQKFDVVVIDEAGQALEAQCWVALVGARKVVLAGDHLQLPPTVKAADKSSKEKKEKNDGGEKKSSSAEEKAEEKEMSKLTLETTLFDRMLKLHGSEIKTMLTTQYRMHEKIMAFPSEELYDSKLVAADSVKDRLLKDLPYGVEGTDDTREPLVFCDTQGGDFPETNEEEEVGKKAGPGLKFGESKSNSGEAAIVKKHVKDLVNAGVKPEDIAVVTPYNAQLAQLARMLKEAYPGLELGSVDGFQGREKEAVIVSLVRSGGEVGFLAEKRRLNVSMTRPKRHLCVVGDSATLTKGSKFLKRWMAHLEEHSDLRYPNPAELEYEDS
ncbi:DNA helicase [Microthyrium microscopicum]|uniref:DNA helicase n=1 Tax=Microthyrium microscopicum TaxID=703497 RepID=A0A6A6UG74_9PEZI|nr:DNA helicase [Microthyrium microscopicum]